MSRPRISMVVARARNGVIGANNALPWHLPGDLKYFKRVTMGHPIVMGRKTYDSIGRLLPGRKNVIVTRQKDYCVPGAAVVHSADEALRAAADASEVFVIGGAQLFTAFMDRTDRLYVTEIERDYPGDVYFPGIDPAIWIELSRESHEERGLRYHFVVYERRTRVQP